MKIEKNIEVVLLTDRMEDAINEIIVFGKAKMSQIQERKRRLTKIRQDMRARNDMGQMEIFNRAASISPELEEILDDPTKGW